MNPFALLHEIRQVFDGLLILSGSLSTGGDIVSAQAMGGRPCLYGHPLYSHP